MSAGERIGNYVGRGEGRKGNRMRGEKGKGRKEDYKKRKRKGKVRG